MSNAIFAADVAPAARPARRTQRGSEDTVDATFFFILAYRLVGFILGHSEAHSDD